MGDFKTRAHPPHIARESRRRIAAKKGVDEKQIQLYYDVDFQGPILEQMNVHGPHRLLGHLDRSYELPTVWFRIRIIPSPQAVQHMGIVSRMKSPGGDETLPIFLFQQVDPLGNRQEDLEIQPPT